MALIGIILATGAWDNMPPQAALGCRALHLLLNSLSRYKHIRMMSAFTLPGPVTVQSIPKISEDQLRSFPAFNTWFETVQGSLALQAHESHEFHDCPFKLRSIAIQSCDFFGGKRLGFLKLRAEVTNNRGQYLPGSVFLRGGSVCMPLILQPDDVNASEEE
jgi:ADP-sugar diphosphatase